MKKYRLIALDVDGTVLNDKKILDPATEDAIHNALQNGIEVVFCTGRSFAEMKEILEKFPDMHYLSGESGALLYDIKAQKPVSTSNIPIEVAMALWETAENRDITACVFSDGKCLIDSRHLKNMDHFHMGQYQKLYERIAVSIEDPLGYVIREQENMEKINLYHAVLEERDESFHKLQAKNLPAELVYSEYSSLECTAKGLTKAKGLKDLGELLGIGLGEMVMVGDADNDLDALKAVGYAIAMGNANEKVKAVCDMEVADNNHLGCAQAVNKIVTEENYD